MATETKAFVQGTRALMTLGERMGRPTQAKIARLRDAVKAQGAKAKTKRVWQAYAQAFAEKVQPYMRVDPIDAVALAQAAVLGFDWQDLLGILFSPFHEDDRDTVRNYLEKLSQQIKKRPMDGRWLTLALTGPVKAAKARKAKRASTARSKMTEAQFQALVEEYKQQYLGPCESHYAPCPSYCDRPTKSGKPCKRKPRRGFRVWD